MSREKLPATTDYFDLGWRVKSVRAELGYTQQQLADKLSIGVQSIIRYEKGERRPRSEFLIDLSKLGKGYRSDWLLHGRGPIHNDDAPWQGDAVAEQGDGLDDPWEIIRRMAAQISKLIAENSDLKRILAAGGKPRPPPPPKGE